MLGQTFTQEPALPLRNPSQMEFGSKLGSHERRRSGWNDGVLRRALRLRNPRPLIPQPRFKVRVPLFFRAESRSYLCRKEAAQLAHRKKAGRFEAWATRESC